MPKRSKTMEERVVDLEMGVADLAALLEEIYDLLARESIHRLHAAGHSVRTIAEMMGRQQAYVKRVLRDQATSGT
jgi:uncharacterized coiled-coil protein SlyX